MKDFHSELQITSKKVQGLKFYFHLLILFCLPILINSCADEGAFELWGIVVDSETQTPINKVNCLFYLNGDLVDEMITDSTGVFELAWSGYVYDRKDYNIESIFSCDDYTSQEYLGAEESYETVTISLVRKE